MSEKKPPAVWTAAKPFLNGGMAGMAATCCVQPIDMVKVRIQIDGGSPINVARTIIKQDGFGSLYRGLSAGLLRQATYTTARLGSFRLMSNEAVKRNDGKNLSLGMKAGIGLTAGAIGAAFGNPADLSLIRMQADSSMPMDQRRNYKNAFDALLRISREEGVLALWKGAGPTVVRAMALNMGMLASFDQSKEMLASAGFTGTSLVLRKSQDLASGISGFFASACSLPFDYIKTQIQKQKPLPDGTLPFRSSMDCAKQVLLKHGPLKFYTGFPTYVVRIAPHVMLTWVFVSQLETFQKNMKI
eukprot:jgi/Chlat1/2983/Chrsp2S08916